MEDKFRKIFSSRQKETLKDKELTEAAVLVPIFYKDGEYHILFTLRSNHVAHHKGQISFPGGARSEADLSLLDTALRETWEEIGLEPKDVKVIGELDDTPTTVSKFIISPFVALIPYPSKFTKNPYEIVEIFDVPIAALLGRANFKQDYQIADGEYMTAYSYEYGGRIIWGATANILKQLLDTLQSASGAQL